MDLNATASLPCLDGKRVLLFLQCIARRTFIQILRKKIKLLPSISGRFLFIKGLVQQLENSCALHTTAATAVLCCFYLHTSACNLNQKMPHSQLLLKIRALCIFCCVKTKSFNFLTRIINFNPNVWNVHSENPYTRLSLTF